MKEQQSQLLQDNNQDKNSKTLQKYKKRLLLQVIAFFTICILIILERIFYQVIIQTEENIIAGLQINTDLVERDQNGKIIAKEITNGFLNFFGDLSSFRIQFLLYTHFLATLYVAFDSYLATKILYVTMAVIYLVSLFQMFYGGARPFWTNSEILGSQCLSNYTHPSLGLILSLYIPYYTFYCWKKKSGLLFLGQMRTSQMAFFICLFILTGITQFINYLGGNLFLINIALGVVCFLLLVMISIALNTIIDKAIKKSTVIQVDAKKYVFYWLLFICLIETFVLIVYSGLDTFLDIKWVQNYIQCTKYQNYDQVTYRYDQVIGPWFTFLQTASVFGWIGAVFGISLCYRKMQMHEWSQGTSKQKIIRAVITNLLIIPSWLFIIFLEDGSNWIEDIGFNEFIIDAVHYFVLYFWIFGYMPILVLKQILKLTNKEKQDFYVILQQKK